MRRKIKKIRNIRIKKRLMRLKNIIIIDEAHLWYTEEFKEHLAYVRNYNKPKLITQSLIGS